MDFKKVSFLGDSGVGKTSLIKSYLGEAENVESTIGIDHYSLRVDTRKIIVWDFSGQTWFADVIISFVRGTDLIVFVFDLSEPRTLPRLLTFWYPQIKQYYEGDKPIVLVGNKMDKEKMDEEKLMNFVKKFEVTFNLVGFLKTSIYKPDSVKALFDKIIDTLFKG